VLLAALAAGCSSAATRAPASTAVHPGSATGGGGRGGAGDSATTLAAAAASRSFALGVDRATAAFVAAVGTLEVDAAADDVTAARTAELSAQAEYDSFRVLETGNLVNASTLDELSSDVVPDESFGGLHAVERDLWTSGPLAQDVSSLAAQAPVVQFLLSRERLGPGAIVDAAVGQLDWAVDVALPEEQEQYSHLGLVDVDATVAAAEQSFSTVEPLARLVDPAVTTAVVGQFAGLSGEIAALGPPTAAPDSAVPATGRLVLSQELDATATTLSRLATALAPFTTTGSPS
jgi:iron uptake system component EfeO